MDIVLGRIAFLIASAAVMVATPVLAKEQSKQAACEQKITAMCGTATITQCFVPSSSWQSADPDCLDVVEQMIAREEAYKSGKKSADAIDMKGLPGQSWGGILRTGPGMDYPKKASLHEGDKVRILEDTGIWFNGYKWYRISSPKGEGFKWGGILCTEGQAPPDGIYLQCP